MKRMNNLLALALGLSSIVTFSSKTVEAQAAPGIQWKKTVIEKKFRSEGVAIGDVNRDRLPDIMVGDFWYEAPAWSRHEIRPPGEFGDGANSYSNAFCCFSDDYNRDGWVDMLVVGFPGKEVYWYENPQNKPGHWKQHLAWSSGCNETPNYGELFGDGKRYLVMGTQPQGQIAWFAPGADPTKPWILHPISKPSTPQDKIPGTEPFSHGLGMGDVNGDKRVDVLVRQGWWEQPANAKTTDQPWTFHPANLGFDCANMYTADVNSDGLNDVISSSAHQKGVWWHQQVAGKGGAEFTQHTIPHDFSQSHAMHFEDINSDGKKDLVTGKRWWAHGPGGDVEPNAAPVLVWIEMKAGNTPQFTTHQIDNDSGIGTQFAVGYINRDNLLDVAISNKRGVFVLEQVRGK